ncbi:MAG: CoA transferase [Lachnospiraceae bacterium]|nr:CoA transferase [Lachnospiraceae bacterium]
MEQIQGALSDLVVLDLTRVVAGPFCTSMLGDMGARIIKIENPKGGDDSRAYGPHINGESAYFAMLNRSKDGVTLNLKAPEGKRIFLEMAKKADIVVENYRPGVMDKLGLGYDNLKEVNDQIIYAAVSGYGSYGRYSQRPGYDILGQAMGGLMSVTGPRGGAPTKAGNAMGDILGGLNLTIGILAAVNARRLIGRGQRVDVSLVDAVLVSLENVFTRYQVSGEIPPRNGNTNPATAPYDSYRTGDGLIVIACGNQHLFELLCNEITNTPEWIGDERFKDNVSRVAHMDELKELIEACTMKHKTQELVDRCLKIGLPAGPVYDVGQIMKDPHIVEDREMFPLVKHPVVGELHVNGDAIKLMETMPHVTRPAPTLGADNERVYAEFAGLTKEQVDAYQAEGVM